MAILTSYTVLGKVVEIQGREGEPQQRPQADSYVDSRAEVTIGEVARQGARVSAEIAGRGIAAVYAEAMLYDAPSGRLFGPLLREHLRATREERTGGLVRPHWEDTLEVAYDYRPSLRLLVDGEGVTLACVTPDRYPTEGRETVWRLEGEHSSAATGAARRAVLEFSADGGLRRALIFKRGRAGQAPAALTIRAGDTFAPAVLVLWRAATGGWQEAQAYASPIALSGPDARCVEQPLSVGAICLGVAVKDMDGRWARRYAEPVAVP